MARDRRDDGIRHFGRIVPMSLEPFLKLGDLTRALNLNIKLDVLGKPGRREVARTDQRLGADHFEFRVRDIRLRVELLAVVDAAIDLA